MRIGHQIFSIIFFLWVIPLKGCNGANSPAGKLFTKDTLTKEASDKYSGNIIRHILLGKHYRNIWATKVQFPIFRLDSVMGGLKPIKLGGGMQTISIHLKDSTGRRYVLRSVDKYPTKVLNPLYRTTILNKMVLDQISAENPYAPLLLAELAHIAGIYHTNPHYFVLNEEPRLTAFHPNLKNCLVMLEEKPHKSWENFSVFDSPQKIINTQEMISLMVTDPEIHLDQYQYLKSRLFDILVNDWDRHAGQWAWLLMQNNGKQYFTPLPRDRDNALFLFDDGIIPFLVSRWYGYPKFQSFHGYYEYIPGLLKNSRFIDPIFLNQLELSDWDNAINEIRTQLTDSAIIASVNKWPKEIIKLEGKRTAKTLMYRRNLLSEAGRQFYNEINRNLTIIGTDSTDLITISRQKDSTNISLKSKSSGKEFYNRTVSNRITERISLYALDGDDEITITGKVKNGLTIEIIGGNGNDSISDQSDVASIFRKTIIFDTETGNRIDFGIEAKNKTGKASQNKVFNREGGND